MLRPMRMAPLSLPLGVATCLLAAACGSADAQSALGQAAPSPTAASPAVGTREVPALWALDGVSEDRREVVIHVAGGGCLTYVRANVADEGDSLRLSAVNSTPTATDVACTAEFTGFPHRVTLPRPLRDGEKPAGECDSTGSDMDANYCRSLKDMVAIGRQPQPTDQPSPPTEVK